MDPPSYGRGPKGEIWKIEEAIHPLVKLCAKLLSDKPLFFLINSYTTGLQPAVLTYMLSTELKDFDGYCSSNEVGLPVSANGLVLPCGASGSILYYILLYYFSCIIFYILFFMLFSFIISSSISLL